VENTAAPPRSRDRVNNEIFLITSSIIPAGHAKPNDITISARHHPFG
jgi:hypothetical protein